MPILILNVFTGDARTADSHAKPDERENDGDAGWSSI